MLALAGFALVAWLAACAINGGRDSPADDAYITYIYGRNLAEGHGVRYNPDDVDPTPGATSVLHVGLTAAAIRAGQDPLVATRALSIVALIVCGLAIGTAGAIVTRRRLATGWLVGAWIALGFAYLPETPVHLAAGMETMLFLAAHALALSWAAIELHRERPGGWPSGILGGGALLLLCLVRPEGAVLALGYPVAVAIARANLHAGTSAARELGRQGLAIAVVVVGLGGFAWAHWKYFGVLLPNPYYVKGNHRIFGDAAPWLAGLGDVALFAALRVVPLIGLIALFVRFHGGKQAWIARGLLLLPALGLLGLLTHVIHEMAGSFRYEYPLIAPLALLVAIGALELHERSRRAFAATLLATSLFLPLILTPSGSPVRDWARHPRSLATRWLVGDPPGTPLTHLGEDLGATGLGSRATILLSGAGQVPYFSRFRAIDWIGLNDNFMSGRVERSLDEVWAYIDGKKPDVVYSILPPAASDAATADDANLRSELVQAFLHGQATELFENWDRDRVQEMFRREMAYVRAHYAFGGCYRLGRQWKSDWWVFVYVRRDSPHRDVLLDALRSSEFVDNDSDLSEVFAFDPRKLNASP